MSNIQTQNFDYTKLDRPVGDYLLNKEMQMRACLGNAYTELGKHLSEAQRMLANNRNGVFEEWYTALGFKKDRVYDLINRYNFILGNSDNKGILEGLPLSLTYEIAKPSAPEELKQAVLDGDITTHKQYREMEAKLKESEECIEALRGALEEELKKPTPEPKVINIPTTPPEVIARLTAQEKELREARERLEQTEAELEKVKEHRGDVQELERKRDDVAKEVADLMAQQRKIREAVDEEELRQHNANEFVAKFLRASKPLLEAKSKLEILGKDAVFHWSSIRKVLDTISILDEVLGMVHERCKTVDVSNISDEEVITIE